MCFLDSRLPGTEGRDALDAARRLWASAPGDGGPYECSVIVPGVMMTDIGPDDVCEINPDGSFQFALSADSEMLATGSISDLFARSESSDPYHYDDGDPIPNPCM